MGYPNDYPIGGYTEDGITYFSYWLPTTIGPVLVVAKSEVEALEIARAKPDWKDLKFHTATRAN